MFQVPEVNPKDKAGKEKGNLGISSHTVDGCNPKQPPVMVLKPMVNNGISTYKLAGFQPSTVGI